MTPVSATLTFWGTALGAALVLSRHTRKLGAVVLCTVGFGGLGVAWERACGCDARRFHVTETTSVVRVGVISHLPQAILGTYLLEHC